MDRGLLHQETVHAWNQAAGALAISVVAPFVMPGMEEGAICIAFLPHFGSPNGMVIEGIVPPDYSQNPNVSTFAKEWGLYRSAINLDLYREFEENRFREALEDWGFFGPPELRPPWLAQS